MYKICIYMVRCRYICVCACIHTYTSVHTHCIYLFMYSYGVATDSRIDKIIGLFCKRVL